MDKQLKKIEKKIKHFQHVIKENEDAHQKQMTNIKNQLEEEGNQLKNEILDLQNKNSAIYEQGRSKINLTFQVETQNLIQEHEKVMEQLNTEKNKIQDEIDLRTKNQKK